MPIFELSEITRENEKELSKGGYYVYGWVCVDWVGSYYYIGKGKGSRYKNVVGRSKHFISVLEHWNVYPYILRGGLSEEAAEKLEEKMKTYLLYEMGHPILDGENPNSALRARSVREAKARLRKTDPNYREGRCRKEIPDFEKFYQKQKDGEITVKEACERLCISRTTWYKRVAELIA